MEEVIEVPNSEAPKKSHALLWVVMSFVILMIILVAVLLIIFIPRGKSIVLGENFELQEGKTARFLYDGEKYVVEVEQVDSDSVNILTADNTITLRLGELRRMDLNNDGKEDVRIKLVRIENGIPVFRIEEIQEMVNCTENWECENWSECINGSRSRTCYDKNGCGTENNRPVSYESCTAQNNPAGEQTCSEKGGKTCGSGTTCNGSTVTSSDTNNCCLGNCPDQQTQGQTCVQKGGTICQSGYSCSISTVSASDTNSCCLGTCAQATTQQTCVQKGGQICSSGTTCSETMETASDTNECCLGECGNYECYSDSNCDDQNSSTNNYCLLGYGEDPRCVYLKDSPTDFNFNKGLEIAIAFYAEDKGVENSSVHLANPFVSGSLDLYSTQAKLDEFHNTAPYIGYYDYLTGEMGFTKRYILEFEKDGTRHISEVQTVKKDNSNIYMGHFIGQLWLVPT